MNYIRYKCARCGAKLESPRELQGRTDRCPSCNQVNRIPCKRSLWGAIFGASKAPDPPAHEKPSQHQAPQPRPTARKARPPAMQATFQIHASAQNDAEVNFDRLRAYCSHCSQVVFVAHHFKGKKVSCPNCGHRMRVDSVRWSEEDERELQRLIGRFAVCSYGGEVLDARQVQQLRQRIHELSRKKAHSGRCSVGMDVEFDSH
jgi:DNA-directed RNA polymerase subunit RPC12/RpoP